MPTRPAMCDHSASESPGQRTSHGESGARITLRNFSSTTIGHNDHVVTTRAELEQTGFEGFVRFQDLPDTDVPTAAVVCAVLRAGSDQPVAFLITSPAGIIGVRDPSASLDALAETWVGIGVDAEVTSKVGRAAAAPPLAGRVDRHGHMVAGIRAPTARRADYPVLSDPSGRGRRQVQP